jgi:hypothetical protein
VEATESKACPPITLHLRYLEIVSPVFTYAGADLVVACRTNTGRLFPEVVIPEAAAFARSLQSARFSLNEPVATLRCGEAVSCRVLGTVGGAQGEAFSWVQLFDWGTNSCWFDYRHFVQSE